MSLSDIRARVEAQSTGEGEPETALKQVEPTPNHYCLEPGHSTQLVSREREFYADPEVSGGVDSQGRTTGAPICPVCSARAGKPKRVSAVALDAPGMHPQGFRSLAARLGQDVEELD